MNLTCIAHNIDHGNNSDDDGCSGANTAHSHQHITKRTSQGTRMLLDGSCHMALSINNNLIVNCSNTHTAITQFGQNLNEIHRANHP